MIVTEKKKYWFTLYNIALTFFSAFWIRLRVHRITVPETHLCHLSDLDSVLSLGNVLNERVISVVSVSSVR